MSSALSMETILGKLVSTVCSDAGWYLTQHRWLVKFSSYFFVKETTNGFFYCAGETDPSAGRQVGKENV